MKQISEVDPNFRVSPLLQREGIRFYDTLTAPFRIYGVFQENGKFRRMPEKAAAAVSEGVYQLHANTAGGRVRFCTDSPYIALKAEMESIGKMPHFPMTGSAGFDLYRKENGKQVYVGTFVPPLDLEDGYESILELPGLEQGACSMTEYTIDFPLYSDVRKLYIGLDSAASVGEAAPYRHTKPVVFYGSSITQGGCASRPGNSYQSILSRRLDCDFVNLGFSGNAKGEDAMTAYIRSLDMALFVLDYDHNAPTAEYLQQTHSRMFRTIRQAQPDLPVILMTRPRYSLTSDEEARFAIIRATYEEAKASGDTNVYLLTGRELMRLCREDGTVDNSHPNDFGFASMARALGDLIEANQII